MSTNGHPGDTSDYATFLAAKHISAKPSGFEAGELPSAVFPFQADVIRWNCLQGRSADWLAVGLGKTLIQLSWSDQVFKHTGGNILILCPLAVAKQTAREAAKFGIETPVKVCRSQMDMISGINVTNYQMLKHFDGSKFVGVVIDESDILADFMGATKRMIVDKFRGTPYKLDCSATPAPNDYMEIGNHCDFLDVLPSNDMLARWFINDLSEAGKYRLKEHGKADFWRWIGTWAVAINLPSDLGYEDGDYNLPPLRLHEHIVEVDNIDGRSDGMLFRLPSMSATSMHAELRRTVERRVGKAAEIVAGIPEGDQVILWCHTDNEADEIRRQLPDVVEVRGSHTIERKERAIEDFQLGKIRILCGKPSMWGHGLNLQCCHHMIHVGLDYSLKGLLQSIGRCLRFGQHHPVDAHLILAETEGRLLDTYYRKKAAFDEMNARMVEAVGRYGLGGNRKRRTLLEYNPTVAMKLPPWLKGANP